MLKDSVSVIRTTALAKFTVTTCFLNVQPLTTKITSSSLVIAVIVHGINDYCQEVFKIQKS